VSGNAINDNALFHISSLVVLEELRISRSYSSFGTEIPGITDIGLAHMSHLSKLKRLYLMCNCNADGNGFASWYLLADLEVLEFYKLNGSALEYISRIPNIKHLDVGFEDESCNDTDIAHIAKMSKLKTLNLSSRNCRCTGEGFSGWHRLVKLESLTLEVSASSDIDMTELSLKHVFDIPNITKLDLSLCRLSDSAFKGLHKLQHLELLHMPGDMKDEESGLYLSLCNII